MIALRLQSPNEVAFSCRAFPDVPLFGEVRQQWYNCFGWRLEVVGTSGLLRNVGAFGHGGALQEPFWGTGSLSAWIGGNPSRVSNLIFKIMPLKEREV